MDRSDFREYRGVETEKEYIEKKYVLVAFVLIVIGFLFFYLKYNELYNQKNRLEESLSNIGDILTEKTENLEEKISENDEVLNLIDDSLSNIKIDLKTFEDKLNEVNEGLDNLSSDFNEFDSSVSKTLDWIRSNSVYESESLDKCVHIENNSCSVYLDCIYSFNIDQGITYIDDDGDNMKSISNTISDGGGDCEDISLLFMAEYNYITSLCKEFKLWALKESPGETCYLNETHEWQDFSCLEINGYGHISVVCTDDHCLNILANEKLDNLDDINSFDGGYLFEPQQGNAWFVEDLVEEGILDIINQDSIIVYRNENWFILKE